MPNIKRKHKDFLYTKFGEELIVSISGAIVFTLIAVTSGWVATYASTTVYPFSYPFLHSPLHSLLPRLVQAPPIPATPIFAALFSLGIYHFEKNIFYRRFSLALKAGFASVAACTFVFISSLLSFISESVGIDMLGLFLYRADVGELPALFIYYYLTSLPMFFLSGQIRRRIFALP